MAGLTFRFDGRSSAVREWDIRFRVAGLAVVGIGILSATPGALFILGIGVVTLLRKAKARWSEIGRVAQGLAGFLALFWILNWFFEPTIDQAIFLFVQSVRLLLLFLTGHVLLLAATPHDVVDGIRWYFGFLGKRRAWAWASMASWALASIPQVLDQARELLEAARLRGLSLARHPGRVLRLVTLSLVTKALERADHLADAMEARNWGVSIPDARHRARASDVVALVGVLGWVALALVFGVFVKP